MKPKNEKRMQGVRWSLGLCALGLTLALSCGDSTSKDGGKSNQSEADMGDGYQGGGGDCNNVFVECEPGWAPADFRECTSSNEVCQESLGGECTEPGTCICEDACRQFPVSTCDGHPNCEERQPCGETEFCASCVDDPGCGDRESRLDFPCSDYPTAEACRTYTCPSDPALEFHCVRTEEVCEGCPDGMVECAEPSETCQETATCAQLRLCEPAEG